MYRVIDGGAVSKKIIIIYNIITVRGDLSNSGKRSAPAHDGTTAARVYLHTHTYHPQYLYSYIICIIYIYIAIRSGCAAQLKYIADGPKLHSLTRSRGFRSVFRRDNDRSSFASTLFFTTMFNVCARAVEQSDYFL